MISNEDFSKLRLRDFFPDLEPVPLKDWEYEGRIWVGEAIGFTEWLYPEETPTILGSIALYMPELPKAGLDNLLSRLSLPLSTGMSCEQVFGVFGSPTKTYAFAEDRSTYEFRACNGGSYLVSCTIKNEGGLCYLTMLSTNGQPT
jgi:hypothetical protein